jgi:hypothetical protein
MHIERIMVLWNVARRGGAGAIKVVEHPDDHGRYHNDDAYNKSTGACDVRWTQMDDDQRVTALFKLFYQLTARDGLDPAKVHAEFCKIEEFADAAEVSMFPHDYAEALDRLMEDRQSRRG